MKIQETLANTIAHLMAQKGEVAWRGKLSQSALSTATGCFALHQVDAKRYEPQIEGCVRWLVTNQNKDGGWGDTPISRSNLSTTLLVRGALTAAGGAPSETNDRALSYLTRRAGGTDPEQITNALFDVYQDDLTFSVPILCMLSLCGVLGQNPWPHIPALPFELALFPQQWFRWLNLRVVSYALPALIAMGQLIHVKNPSRNPIARLIREKGRSSTLKTLGRIQPLNGGYLEAIPLTSFVVMSLANIDEKEHSVVQRGCEFICSQIREDGGLPIDSSLSTWVTSLSIEALGSRLSLDETQKNHLKQWYLDQQWQVRHPMTFAEPGGWAWTPDPGGVPDADDTSGALIALHRLDPNTDPKQVRAGLIWLRGLQNRDGGIPTFCKGWGKLPFDQSCPEVTAHAILAFRTWRHLEPKAIAFLKRCYTYLQTNQTEDGSWIPLWFGHQNHPHDQNPVYGTAKVLIALDADYPDQKGLERAQSWLQNQQNQDGGWGGSKGLPSSLEETSLAIIALAKTRKSDNDALKKAVEWLMQTTQNGTEFPAAPIGFYFASLWYYEDLYPIIYTIQALRAYQEKAQRD